MSDKRMRFFFIVFNLLIINGVTLAVLNLKYPLVGHDYTLALPSLLDTAIHYRLNGLSIQWFTPTFGGGIPAFPNPNNMQFSIPALLATLLPPWTAIMLSAVFYISAGFIACYYFFLRILKLDWTASLLGAFFFSANGFMITRTAVGHLGYFSFPLLAFFLILLFEKRLSTSIATAGMGLLLATYIHSAGYFILIIFGLSILMVAPLLFLYKPEIFNWKRIFTVIFVGGILGIIISVSKLAASFAFMRHFPRLAADNYPVSFLVGFLGIAMSLLGTQTLAPLFVFAGIDPSTYPDYLRGTTGTQYGMWELDNSLTPAVFIIVVVCVIKFTHNPRKYFELILTYQEKLAIFAFLFFTYTAIEFTLAKGFIYPAIRHLPILSSLRGNVRFTGAFIFPLAFFAAAVMNHWLKRIDSKRLLQYFLLVNLFAIIPLGSYFLFKQDMFWMFYDIAGPQQIYNEIQSGQSFEITNIGAPAEGNTGALLHRTSNLNVYEPVFGTNYEYYLPTVKKGSIWDTKDDYYNMTDPTSLVYPELNHNKSFDRFRLTDKLKLELFAKHLQPDWIIPTYQIILNWISEIAGLATTFFIITRIILDLRAKSNHEA